MNWTIIILVGAVLLELIIFIVIRNRKDEKEVEKQIEEDYPKPKYSAGDIEMDEAMK